MTADAIAGGCLCGAIRFSIAGAPLALSLCHCLTCRRASSAPSVAWVVVRRSDFAVVSGQPRSSRSSPHVTRTFCGNCGSPLSYRHDDNLDTIDVTTVRSIFRNNFPRFVRFGLSISLTGRPSTRRRATIHEIVRNDSENMMNIVPQRIQLHGKTARMLRSLLEK